MIKPAQLLALTAVAFGAATLQGMPASVIGVKSPTAATGVASLTRAQHALAIASERLRTTAECGLQGARDRARAVSC